MGLREFAVTLIALLGLYLLSVVWRWLRLSRKTKHPARSAHLGKSIESTPTLERGPTSARRDVPAGQETVDGDPPVHCSAEPAVHRARAEPDTSSFGSDALLAMQQAHHDVDALRNERARLEEEVTRLRTEVTELNAVLSKESRATAPASPLYDEAVRLARHGITVQVIAERCGISISEAELVRAIAATRRLPE